MGGELEEQALPRRVGADEVDEVRRARPGLVLGLLVARQHAVDLLQVLREAVVEHGEEQLLLAVEVRVERALGEARPLGDLVDRGPLHPALGEHLGGGLEQARPRLGLLLGPCQPGRRHAATAAGTRWDATTFVPWAGLSVMARLVTRSPAGTAGLRSTCETMLDSTCLISNRANVAPRQRRTPPPKGIQVYVPAGFSRNRSGRNRRGSG